MCSNKTGLIKAYFSLLFTDNVPYVSVVLDDDDDNDDEMTDDDDDYGCEAGEVMWKYSVNIFSLVLCFKFISGCLD